MKLEQTVATCQEEITTAGEVNKSKLTWADCVLHDKQSKRWELLMRLHIIWKRYDAAAADVWSQMNTLRISPSVEKDGNHQCFNSVPLIDHKYRYCNFLWNIMIKLKGWISPSPTGSTSHYHYTWFLNRSSSCWIDERLTSNYKWRLTHLFAGCSSEKLFQTLDNVSSSWCWAETSLPRC